MLPERSRLELDAERMRELGYRTVDALVDWGSATTRNHPFAVRRRQRPPRGSRRHRRLEEAKIVS